MVITRFAPSPTGDPHIGNIRTALFAYLFAKKHQGQFLLRIEDTDQKRYNEQSIAVIQDALRWLEIIPDNLDEPMVQSTRLDLYKQEALRLVVEGKAYVCNCSKERLDGLREEQLKSGRPPGYDGHCRDLGIEYSPECVVRMKVPRNEKIVIDDLIRGNVEFDTSVVDDQIILKSDGFPTYHLAHIVDDHAMNVTHVIRAEEWLPSTPKHILLNQMLGYSTPQYAHLPVILSPNKGKLSKRDGAVGILQYREMGYLPQAMVNFMVLLGWNPKNDQELFDRSQNIYDEIIEKFDIGQINKAPAVFDINKLNFFNRHYLQKIPATDLLKDLDADTMAKIPRNSQIQAVEMAKDRMTTLNDFGSTIGFLTDEPNLDADLIIFRKSTKEQTSAALSKVIEKIGDLETYGKEQIKSALEAVVQDGQFSNGDVFWPTRYALSGEEKSPPPEEIAAILGQEETVRRLKSAVSILS